MKTGILKDKHYLEHNMGDYHVETPKRLEAIYSMIEEEIRFPYYSIVPRKAEEDDILAIHSRDYFESIRDTSGKERVFLDPDTSTNARTFDTALLAAGGVLQAADDIITGTINNGFAFVRPPGHHAERSRAMGFCFFNNIAIAADHLIKKHGIKRVLIADWDIHHGNGTQNSFYTRDDVLFFSTHQYPYYPGTGHWSEAGEERGKGYTVNIPLSPGKTDEDFASIYEKILFPIAAQFKPEFILVSVGFDIYHQDPLGGMLVTKAGFSFMTSILLKIADQSAGGRILFILEGGYNLQGLKEGSKEILLQISGTSEQVSLSTEASEITKKELKPVIEIHKKFWDQLECI